MACCPRGGIPPSPQLNSQLVFGNTGTWHSRDPEAIFRRRRFKTGRKRCRFYGYSLAQWCGRCTERRFLRGEKKFSPLTGGGEWPRMSIPIYQRSSDEELSDASEQPFVRFSPIPQGWIHPACHLLSLCSVWAWRGELACLLRRSVPPQQPQPPFAPPNPAPLIDTRSSHTP